MRQCGLFEGPFLSEQGLHELIEPIYPQLWTMIRRPFDDLADRRGHDNAFRILEEGEAAQWLRPQIVEAARGIFADSPDIAIRKRRHQLFISYRDEVAIVPKKIKKKWRDIGLTFSSYRTRQNLRYWAQAPIDGLPRLPRLIVGYQFIEEMSDIKIWLAYPHGKDDLGLCFLMPDQTGAIGAFEIDVDEESTDKGYRVRPKKDFRRSDNA